MKARAMFSCILVSISVSDLIFKCLYKRPTRSVMAAFFSISSNSHIRFLSFPFSCHSRLLYRRSNPILYFSRNISGQLLAMSFAHSLLALFFSALVFSKALPADSLAKVTTPPLLKQAQAPIGGCTQSSSDGLPPVCVATFPPYELLVPARWWR